VEFVARFSGEITPEVGPPFLTYLLGMNNRALTIINHTLSPIEPERILEKLRELGYSVRDNQ
jgi:hypothetical protein